MTKTKFGDITISFDGEPIELTGGEDISDSLENINNKNMTNEEILKKAIEKATRNGYKELSTEAIMTMIVPKGGITVIDHERWYYPIIFSHDFAKAFWGEKRIGRDFVHNRDIYLAESSSRNGYFRKSYQLS